MDFDAADLDAVDFDAADLDAVDFEAVDFAGVLFLAAVALVVLFFVAAFLAGALVAVDDVDLVEDFLAGALVAVDLVAGAFLAVVLAAVLDAADFEDVDLEPGVARLAAAAAVPVATAATVRTDGGLGMVAAVSLGSFLAPETMFLRS
ncbi:hypothetical protein [Nocardioides sp. Soil805]|uniref:hypothetical protein n=1 Tax=Nocardioides sp. Soil805 TaxID=1736416 RepID=UPI003FA5C650